MQTARTLVLNEGQTLASEGFFDFLLGPEKELNISGPGGVGKTFLMGHLIDEVMPRYYDTCQLMGVDPEFDNIHMTATTNKAAEVLGKQTGRPTSTVHAFFGLKVFDDYTTGESKVEKSRSWQVHHRIILFIDEASMIDSQLYALIQEGTMNCKIVYLGDKNQMAPVKETLSPVYKKPSIPMFQLLEPMRTSIPELQALNAQCRATVESGEFTGICEFKPIVEVPGIIDFIDGDQFMAEIEAGFKEAHHDNVILAYTNARVIEYNSHIRDLRGLPPVFTLGEELVSNTAAQFGKHALRIEDEVEIVRIDDTPHIVMVAGEVEMQALHATIRNAYGDEIRIRLPVDRTHYDQLVNYYRRAKNWHAYYDLKNSYPDLRQKDARTVYKIQGSSVSGTVYIDADNLNKCHNPAQAARLIYVAVSRARKRVAIYGSLALKYGGMQFAARG